VHRRAIAVVTVALVGCAAPPAPVSTVPQASAAPGRPPPRVVGPLVRVPERRDVTSVADRPVHGDGRGDFAIRVRLGGPVTALYLTLSDPDGEPIGNAVWDTVTRDRRIPESARLSFSRGDQTTALAVTDARGTVLNPDGELAANTVFRDDDVTLYAADPWGLFAPGRAFTLLVERPDGTFDRSTIVLL
jgi:hypothetical protein